MPPSPWSCSPLSRLCQAAGPVRGACGLLNVAEALGRGKDGSAEGGDGGQAEAKRCARSDPETGAARAGAVGQGQELWRRGGGDVRGVAEPGFDADARRRGEKAGPTAGAGRTGREEAAGPTGRTAGRGSDGFRTSSPKPGGFLRRTTCRLRGPVLSAEATAAVLANFGLTPRLRRWRRWGRRRRSRLRTGRGHGGALMDGTQHAAQLSREDLKFMALASMRAPGRQPEAGAAAASAPPEDHQASCRTGSWAGSPPWPSETFGEDRPHCKKVLDSLLEHPGAHAEGRRARHRDGTLYAVFALGKGFRAVYDQMLMQLLRGIRRALPPHDRPV